METTFQLAIVIPAFKAQFLSEALASLSIQTDQNRFIVYVGDDASPEPIQEICEKYSEKLNLKYHRFPENMGSISLVDQWHRCIELTSEPWIWIFSDDDMLEEGCVNAFFTALKKNNNKFDLYRFNTLVIDEKSHVTKICPPHPLVESGIEFLYHRLCRNRESFISEYIFSRRIYKQKEGLVSFPLAWCSDDASWINFADKKGIFTIYGPKVYWRKSNVNISSVSSKTRLDKIKACIEYFKWLEDYFNSKSFKDNLIIKKDIINELQTKWLYLQIKGQAPLDFHTIIFIIKNDDFSVLGNTVKRLIKLLAINFSYIKTYILNLFVNNFKA